MGINYSRYPALYRSRPGLLYLCMHGCVSVVFQWRYVCLRASVHGLVPYNPCYPPCFGKYIFHTAPCIWRSGYSNCRWCSGDAALLCNLYCWVFSLLPWEFEELEIFLPHTVPPLHPFKQFLLTLGFLRNITLLFWKDIVQTRVVVILLLSPIQAREPIFRTLLLDIWWKC